MTRYLCAHPGHDRKGRAQAVDVTAQVRLEREFLPRESSYLASTDDVIARVVALRSGDSVDRLAQVRRMLTGTTAPIDAPVVLAARATDRVPGPVRARRATAKRQLDRGPASTAGTTRAPAPTTSSC